MGMKFSILFVLVFLANSLLSAQNPADVAAVQASSALSGKPFGNCIAFDRLVTPPTVVAFKIPDGKVFIVKSLDWKATIPSRAGKTVIALFFAAVGGNVNGPSAIGVGQADSEGTAGGSIVLPSGLVVRENQQLCVAIQMPGANQYFPADGVAHGFFAARNENRSD